MQNNQNSGSLRLPQIIALYIGSVLGSGILIIPGIAADMAGPASLLAWGIMAVLVLPMSLTMGLMSARFPNVGGVSYFVTRAFDAKLGSLIGWYFAMSVVIGAPVLALTGAGYITAGLGIGVGWRMVIAIAILLIGLGCNYVGMKLTGQVQLAVVVTTLAVLIVAICGSLPKIESNNFNPFMPDGFMSVGSATTILFWCFIGWEAVSNLSHEFQDPERDAVLGTTIAAIVISIIYFLTALVIVGTHSYGAGMSDASLVHVIKIIFGPYGAAIAGFAALFICMAPAIAYIGAASHLLYSLAENNYAPQPLALLSKRFRTPLGGLCFLAVFFAVILIIFSTKIISLAMLIQIPNASFIITYLGGCAAGVKLLGKSKFGFSISLVSFLLSAVILLFVKWSVLYPVVITICWFVFMKLSGRLEKDNRLRL